MAKTTFSTSDGLTKKIWDEKLFRDAKKATYFDKFTGDTPQSIVYEKTNLTKSQGDAISFGIRMRLTGAGITSGTQLEGNEEKLTTYSYQLTLEQYRHAVRDNGAIDRQRAMFSISDESESAIKDWGTEKLDQLIFDALATTPTKTFYQDKDATGAKKIGTAATAKAQLSSSYPITLAAISFLKAVAKTGQNRAFVPLRPIKIGGKEYYVLLVHPEAMYDLKANSDFQQAMREADTRGDENKLFTGATAIWDGVVIHEHENIALGTDGGGSTVHFCKASLLGAQALCLGWGKRGRVVQKTFDYENEEGYAYDMICKAGKPVFNSLDYGSIGVYLPCTNLAA